VDVDSEDNVVVSGFGRPFGNIDWHLLKVSSTGGQYAIRPQLDVSDCSISGGSEGIVLDNSSSGTISGVSIDSVSGCCLTINGTYSYEIIGSNFTNCGYAVCILGQGNNLLTDVYFNTNSIDLLLDNDGDTRFSYNLVNVTFTDTVISADDFVDAGSEYTVDSSNAPAGLPTVLDDTMHYDFDNKFIDIVVTVGTVSIDNIIWHWLDSEIGVYVYENFFEIWGNNGAWFNIPAVTDNVSNTLTVSDLVPASKYGILEKSELTNLSIWDDTDPERGNMTRYAANDTYFFANFTDSKGKPVKASQGGQCNISFNATPNGPFSMTYNATGELYYYSRNFTLVGKGNYTWNVTCGAPKYNTSFAEDWVLINNTPPPQVTLLLPTDGNDTLINRKPFFNWTDSIDIDGDSVNYTINITNNGTCPNIFDTGINVSNYTPNIDLCVDLVYYWNIMPFDGEDNGTLSETWNFTIMSYIDINLTRNATDFESMLPLTSDDTSDGSPLPLIVENTGNVFADITFNGTWIFSATSPGGTDYQFAADNATEPNSFNWSASQTTYANVDESAQNYIFELNYSDAADEAELEINLTIPQNETPGTKQSTIILTGVAS